MARMEENGMPMQKSDERTCAGMTIRGQPRMEWTVGVKEEVWRRDGSDPENWMEHGQNTSTTWRGLVLADGEG